MILVVPALQVQGSDELAPQAPPAAVRHVSAPVAHGQATPAALLHASPAATHNKKENASRNPAIMGKFLYAFQEFNAYVFFSILRPFRMIIERLKKMFNFTTHLKG